MSRLSHNPHDPWKSSLASLESSSSRMDTTTGAGASWSAQRSPQKTSGPFNTDLTDVTSPVASVPDFWSLDSLFTDEECKLTGPSPSSSLPQISDLDSKMIRSEVAVDSLVDLEDFKGTLDFDLGSGSDFLENYTDLSNYFMDTEASDKAETTAASLDVPMTLDESAILEEMFQSLAPVNMVPTPVAEAPSVEEGQKNKGRKRKAANSATVVTATEVESTTSIAECSSDHSYTAKRPRVSTETSSAANDDSDDDDEPSNKELKYLERRRKNNIASKRSRETRKQKFTQMEEKAIELEKANEELRDRVSQLEELAKEMKDALIKRLAQSK